MARQVTGITGYYLNLNVRIQGYIFPYVCAVSTSEGKGPITTCDTAQGAAGALFSRACLVQYKPAQRDRVA